MVRRLLLAAVAAIGITGGAAGLAMAQQRLVVAAYGGSYESIMRQSVIPAFERANNARVDYLAGNSSDSLARLQAQRGRQEVGVAVLDDGPMTQAISLGLCQKATDQAAVSSLYPVAVMGEGRALGTGFGFTGIAYNTRVFRERNLPVPTSWMDLARPEFRRRLAIPGIDNTYGLHILSMMARVNGGGETNIDPGFRAMRERINPNVLAYESSPGKMSEMFQSGEIWLAVWGSSRAAAMVEAGFPMGFVRPKEGGVVLMTAACAVEGTPNPDLAQKFLAHLVSPEVQASFSRQYGSGPTNRNTQLPPEIAAKVIYGEEQVRGLVSLDWGTINANRTEWTRRWQREVER
ncbi:putative spermidine/putrescine transport system substrate-binding protein [Roseomonas rosea]|uniref:Putative spermidine/putrescine transport system substrate-binding protein n=1 Tax=Muricoccus roseus TaxID=198092 RepID=A0A1M6HJW1_9PROT|nr:ABC transporter substrate-binding protein [Roseomonas rosea]SHJ22399.1 putative spermidine/putrescine transport system substrate-binding protein [Roseomonas rosea]